MPLKIAYIVASYFLLEKFMPVLNKKFQFEKIIKFVDPFWEGFFRISMLRNEKHSVTFVVCGQLKTVFRAVLKLLYKQNISWVSMVHPGITRNLVYLLLYQLSNLQHGTQYIVMLVDIELQLIDIVWGKKLDESFGVWGWLYQWELQLGKYFKEKFLVKKS